MSTMIDTEAINQMRRCAFQGKPYRTDVETTVEAIAISGSLDKHFSILATGATLMTDIGYKVVDFKGDEDSTLIIEVVGRVEDVVKDLDSRQVVDG